jgi:hypothetical protein
MARRLAGLTVLLVVLSATALPLATSDQGLVEVTRIAQDGSRQRVEARLVDVVPPALPAPRQASPVAQQEQAPPDDAGSLAAERARPTRTVTFYGHVFGSGLVPGNAGNEEFGPDGPQAANTIYPTGDANLGLGVFDWCSDTVNMNGFPAPQPSAWNNCDKDPFNKVALFLTAGPVQVHSREEFVYSKLHNERGRTKDIVLDSAGEIKAWLWMSLDYHAWSVGNGGDNTNCIVALPPDVGCPYPYWGWDPAHWPQWVVEADLYMVELGEYGQGASEPPPIFEQWQADAMTLIASGATPPQDVTNGLPGSDNVHEFEVNLGAPQVDVIPKTHDVVLVYHFYSLLNGQKVSMHTWRIWAGELFPTRFSMPVKNALDVELVIPQFVHNKALVHSVIASGFGSYDVDVESARLTILDPNNQPVTPTRIIQVGDYQVAHGAHFKPVNITWIWDYKADGARPGQYKTQVSACNMQGSACEVTEGSFTLDSNLNPVEVRVGRSGQRTVSDQQLSDLTGGGSLGTQGLSPQVAKALQDMDAAPAQSQGKAVPGPAAALAVLAALGAALVLRRRWF